QLSTSGAGSYHADSSGFGLSYEDDGSVRFGYDAHSEPEDALMLDASTSLSGGSRRPIGGEVDNINGDDDDDDDDDEEDGCCDGKCTFLCKKLRCRRCCHPSGNSLLAVTGVSALLGGLTFGYDLGVIGDALLALRPQFRLTCPEQELIVSALPLGAFAGSLLVSPLMDRYGRRRILRANCALLIGASAALTAAPSLWLLLAGRLLLGVGVAVCATGECLYASEVAAPKRRGALVSANELGITLGLLLAYASGYLLLPNWRLLFALPGLLALLQLACLQPLPPSPRYLLAMGRRPQAEAVLKRLRRGQIDADIVGELLGIERAVRLESGRRVADLIRSDAYGGYRRRFLIGCCLVLLQQLSGQSCLLYYAPTVLMSVGFRTSKEQTLAAIGVGAVKVLSCIVSLALVDRVGRRRILIAGSAVMAAALAVFSIITAVAEQSFKRSSGSNYTIGICLESTIDLNSNSSSAHSNDTLSSGSVFDNLSDTTPGGFVALATLLVFVAAYSASFGPVVWLVLSEIFPASLRARAVGACSSLNWLAGLATSVSFLSLLQGIGAPGTFGLYCGVCCLAVAFSAALVPETSGKSLERIGREFERSRSGGRSGGGGGISGIARLRRWLSATAAAGGSGDGTADGRAGDGRQQLLLVPVVED
ncbi:hypothetical protein BOX15_Mlig022338g1, partial [Macrostomum lignano]